MSEKPEALEVADSLERPQPYAYLVVDEARVRAAVRLLRHLHAENERLREALEMIAGYRPCVIDGFKRGGLPGAVIAKAALRREETT